MNRKTHRTSIATLAFITLATMGFTQNSNENKMQQVWTQFEKELNLQPSYSVDMEMTTFGITTKATTIKLKDKLRTELTIPLLDIKIINLELPEGSGHKSVSLFPNQKRYVVNPDTTQGATAINRESFTLQDLGKEEHEGINCTKKRMTVKDGGDESHIFDILFSPKVKNMPVKITSTIQMPTATVETTEKVSAVILFRNYNFAPPAASLFDIPSNYSKAENMEEVMMANIMQDGGIAELFKNIPVEALQTPAETPPPPPAVPGRINLRKGLLNVLRQAIEE